MLSNTLYTVNVNGVDSFKEPEIITPGWEYHYFTDNRSFKSDIWKITYIDSNSAKEARRIKIMNPFKDNPISIWIDSSMLINCDLNNFVSKYCRGDFNLMNHPHRNCIYEEAKACIQRKKDDPNIINNQITKYRRLGYPENKGMVATGVIVRRSNSDVHQFCLEWWSEVEKHSKRDQLSFNYIQYNYPIDYNLIPFDILKEEFILQKHIK